MRMTRKEFRHPDGFFATEKDFWWWKDQEPKRQWVAFTFSEVCQRVADFATELGDRLVSISEYTARKVENGDDGVTCFVVWYWEKECCGGHCEVAPPAQN